MNQGTQYVFGPFRLEPDNALLWRGEEAITLRPRTFAVLCYLAEHPGQLLSKAQILDAVWPHQYVSEVVLKVCINEIRKALDDDARAPRYIETVQRRGYRFIGPAVRNPPLVPSNLPSGCDAAEIGSSPFGGDTGSQVIPSRRVPATPTAPRLPRLVGREAELRQLQGALEKALAGRRQVVFVTGEAGIGKTTVVEMFAERVNSDYRSLWIANGQCVEHYGAGEAYLPVLEALGRLCRPPQRERLIALLRRYAPTWLGQMPWLLDAEEQAALQCLGAGTTRERMLREMGEAVDAVTAEIPLVLVLEDLHWSDYATQDLLASLARRKEAARLLVIGTCRPMELTVREHPLKSIKRELQMRGQCAELRLEPLSEVAVREYLRAYLPPEIKAPALQRLACSVSRRTEGNPLFMVQTVAYLTARGVLSETPEQHDMPLRSFEEAAQGMPETLQQMIEEQIDRLGSAEQRLLEGASVVGAEFSAAAVAAALEIGVEEAEESCQGLARRGQFLEGRGTVEWPDGTRAARYGFRHVLYREVLYGRITAHRRMRLHRVIGERQEQAYGDRAEEIAAELAVHFEQGRDYGRAALYLQQAAVTDIRRSALQEAIHLLTKGLDLLGTLDGTPDRARLELSLQITLGSALFAAKGYATPEVEIVYARARALCREIGETSQMFPALSGLWAFHCVRAELQIAYELAEQLHAVAEGAQDPALLMEAYRMLGVTYLCLGKLPSARGYLEQAVALYDFERHGFLIFLYGQDSGVICLVTLAWTLCFLGYPRQAVERIEEALALARARAHPHSHCLALHAAAWIHHFSVDDEVAGVMNYCEALARLDETHGFPLARETRLMMEGWILAVQGQIEAGIARIRAHLTDPRPIVMPVMLPFYWKLLADACSLSGQIEEGLDALAEGFAAVERFGSHYFEAELHRTQGELTLKCSQARRPEMRAEECFRRAIAVARRQGGTYLELRAAVSLSRLWLNQGKDERARELLAEVCGGRTEGLDSADWREALALFEDLSVIKRHAG